MTENGHELLQWCVRIHPKVDTGSMSGPKLRANYTWYSKPHRRLLGVFDRIALEAQITYDHIRKTDWYTGVRFSINLGRNATHQLSRQEQHLVDTIRRDINIIDREYTEPNPQLLKNSDGTNVLVEIPTTYTEFAEAVQESTLKQIAAVHADASTPNIVGVEGQLIAESGGDLA